MDAHMRILTVNCGSATLKVKLLGVEGERLQDEVERMLHRESGLLALAGVADMRAIPQRDDAAARLALDVFCRRARKYVGAYLALLGGAEAVVCTGGIGENAPEVRRRVLDGLDWFGLELDPDKNARGEGRISRDGARLAAFVVRTDEESVMAREAVRVLRGPR
jgi:acetate kinase